MIVAGSVTWQGLIDAERQSGGIAERQSAVFSSSFGVE